MRKNILLVLATVMFLSLVACGSTAETVTYEPQTKERFNELVQEWLPDSDFVLGSPENIMEDVVCEERDTVYKKESRYRITSLPALEHYGVIDVELMFSDKNGLFGFWITKSGTCVSTAEATFGSPMAEAATGDGYTWLVDDLFIWAEDYGDDTCFLLVCTAVEAMEKYDTHMELLLNAENSNDFATDAPDNSESSAQNEITDIKVTLSAHEFAYVAEWRDGWNGASFNPNAEKPSYNISLSVNSDFSSTVRKVVAPDFSEEYNNEILLEKVSGYQELTENGQFVCDLNGKYLVVRLFDGYIYVMEREDPTNIGSIPTPLSGKWYTEDRSAYYILNPDNSLSSVPVKFSAEDQIVYDSVFSSDAYSKMIFTENGYVLYIDSHNKEALNMGEMYTFESRPFVLSGDTLTITTYDGEELVFTKGD